MSISLKAVLESDARHHLKQRVGRVAADVSKCGSKASDGRVEIVTADDAVLDDAIIDDEVPETNAR